jgi:hypothetical protein
MVRTRYFRARVSRLPTWPGHYDGNLLTFGPPGGVPVLVPGHPFNRSMWQPQVRTLTERGDAKNGGGPTI